ncbi:matrixin family metalloprotease [Haloferula sp.]|uniref:matrixin family metalloprotease n=1 Tax=Haloferula sp. TaxID=2497595 RepID=UPI003C707BAC
MNLRSLASLTLPTLVLAGLISLFFNKSGVPRAEPRQAPVRQSTEPARGTGNLEAGTPSRPRPDTQSRTTRPRSAFEPVDGSAGSIRPTAALGLPKTEKAIAAAFQKAVGPALLRALPEERAEQIYRHFKDRINAPTEPYTYLCWAESAPMAVVEASHLAETAAKQLIAAEFSTQAFQSLGNSRWTFTATDGSTGANGDPITLTWSFAPDGTLTDEGDPSDLIARLAVIYASQGANTTDPPDQQPWFTVFETAIENLGLETGLTFVYEPNDDGADMANNRDGIIGTRGDLRILGAPIDGNFNVLAYNYSPGYGDMVIDTNDSYISNISNNSLRLRNIVSHEVGHGLGLAHVCPIDNTKLMEPFINLGFTGAQFDEVFSLQRKYGDHFEKLAASENNDSPATATPLALVTGTAFIVDERLSIDDNSDSDFFEVSVAAGQSLTVTVTPTSESYLEGGQNQDGSCGGDTLYDFSLFHDLALEILDTDGTTPLATRNLQGPGIPEVINYNFSAAGTYFVRVAGDSTNNTQVYSLELTRFDPVTNLSLSPIDLIMDEADSGNTASFTVQSSTPATSEITVLFTTSGTGSASDVTEPLTATIPIGASSSDPVVLSAVSDLIVEGSETLSLSIPQYTSGAVPYGLGSPGTLDIEILDAPAPEVTLVSSDLIMDEADGLNTASLTLNSSFATSYPITVTLSPSGSAEASDFSGSLSATIPAGLTASDPIVLSAVSDLEIEGTETLTLTVPAQTPGVAPYELGSPSALNVEIIDRVAPSLSVTATTIVQESFSEQNGAADPGETVVVEITLGNDGTAGTTLVDATLTGPVGFTAFEGDATYSEIATSASQAATFTFALSGDCGETIELSLAVSDESGYAEVFPISMLLGKLSPNQVEDFEHGGSLPAGWSTSSDGNGIDWVASNTTSSSGTYSAFAPDVSSQGTSFLTSPSIDIDFEGATVSFDHDFNTENTWDGGALEISIDDGPWQDILDSGGSFTAGGYTPGQLRNTDNYLSGRRAWTGDSGGFIFTSLSLPAGLMGSSIRLRWVMACDSFVGDEGWYIDNVSLPVPLTCDTSGPALTLSASALELSEDDPSQTIEIVVSCDPLLPTLKPETYNFEVSGSADLSDISSLDSSPIPAGESSISVVINAVKDELIEGPETLFLGLSTTVETTEISIADTAYATWAFALGAGGNNLFAEDFDEDGSINIEEFVFGTSGDDPTSKPDKQPILDGDMVRIPKPDEAPPGSPTVILELSTNLVDWSSDDVVVGPEFFEFPLSEAQTFYRFGFVAAP